MSRKTLRDSQTDLNAELTAAIRELRASVDASTGQAARLADAIERLLGGAVPGAPPPTAPHLTQPPQLAPIPRTSINWVVGPQENLNWAYGNNARRLSERLGGFEHHVSIDRECDIAVYFDALVAERYPV